jgi:2-methylisocitrate lyase-like PEP mutase family enzyme
MRAQPSTKPRRLRALIAKRTVVLPGAFNALSAMQIERAGFEAIYVSGATLAAARGLPDIGLLSMTEVVSDAATIANAVAIPAVADADTGFGPPLAVMRTVRELERAGVSGIQLEDQDMPKKCGHLPGKRLVSRAEMVGKIKAAVDTRRDADLVIIARSDARAVEGLEAAIDRVNAYLEAGADVGFVEAPQTVDELRVVGQKVRGPALVNVFEGGKTPMLGATELEAMGFRLGIYPSQTHRAAIRAAQRVLAAMQRDGDTHAVEAELATFQDREDAVGTPSWRALEEKYMRIDAT